MRCYYMSSTSTKNDPRSPPITSRRPPDKLVLKKRKLGFEGLELLLRRRPISS